MNALLLNARVADSQPFKSIILSSQTDFEQILDRHMQKLPIRLLRVWYRSASSLACGATRPRDYSTQCMAFPVGSHCCRRNINIQFPRTVPQTQYQPVSHVRHLPIGSTVRRRTTHQVAFRNLIPLSEIKTDPFNGTCVCCNIQTTSVLIWEQNNNITYSGIGGFCSCNLSILCD
jgi:hypothetical protein